MDQPTIFIFNLLAIFFYFKQTSTLFIYLRLKKLNITSNILNVLKNILLKSNWRLI